MKDKNPHYIFAVIIFFYVALNSVFAEKKPVRPYYSETPTKRHIQNNDRLTAEYFNNQLNVIYNWAQNLDHDFTEYLINNVPIASGAHYYGTVKDYMDSVASATYDRAKTYAEDQDAAVLQVLTALQNGVDVLGQQTSDNLGEAKDYADQQANNAYNNSTSYANNLASSTEEAFKKLATATLDAAKGYANSNFSAINHDHDSRYITTVAQGSSNGTIAVTKNGTTSDVSVKGLGSAAYTASTAYATSNHNHNSSYVSAVAQGDSNGQIKVTKNGTATNVSVKGLGSAAYTESSAYATSSHNHNSAYVSAVATGDNNGTIKVTKNGSTSNVAVKGLGSAAYTASTAYAAANHTHTIDSAMSDSSTNPVQNKVIKAYVDSKTSGDYPVIFPSGSVTAVGTISYKIPQSFGRISNTFYFDVVEVNRGVYFVSALTSTRGKPVADCSGLFEISFDPPDIFANKTIKYAYVLNYKEGYDKFCYPDYTDDEYKEVYVNVRVPRSTFNVDFYFYEPFLIDDSLKTPTIDLLYIVEDQ